MDNCTRLNGYYYRFPLSDILCFTGLIIKTEIEVLIICIWHCGIWNLQFVFSTPSFEFLFMYSMAVAVQKNEWVFCFHVTKGHLSCWFTFSGKKCYIIYNNWRVQREILFSFLYEMDSAYLLSSTWSPDKTGIISTHVIYITSSYMNNNQLINVKSNIAKNMFLYRKKRNIAMKIF